MSDNIFEVQEILPEWVLASEALGTKEKFWYKIPITAPEEETIPWLFKYPKVNTGLHWAEKIAAEIAHYLRILHAKVELAVYQGTRGSSTESFIRKGWSLFHGNQILDGQVLGYERDKKFRQSDHTVANVFKAMDKIFIKSEAAVRAKKRFIEYLFLDAIIGNTDRHHENWGVLRRRTKNGWIGQFAPSFDHASSLGRELNDETGKRSRLRILNEIGIDVYSNRAEGAIYWTSKDEKGLSPLELIRRVVAEYAELCEPAKAKFEKIDILEVEKIIDRVPDDWMTPLTRRFTRELICYNIAEIRKEFK